MERINPLHFAAATLFFYAASYLTAYICGLLVDRGVRVNYTRKITHMVTICIPWLTQQVLHYERNLAAAVLAAVLTPCHFMLFIEPIRTRSPTVALMFRGFDRPEDRPHTMLWIVTQYVAVYAIYLLLYPVMLLRGATAWMLIPIFVNAVGDGLAEPVGVAFGRHPYSCSALFTRRSYRRTLEGSACVLLSAVAALVLCRPTFSDAQFLTAMLFVPVSAALAEALSPHTWDAPLLFFVVGAELALISFV